MNNLLVVVIVSVLLSGCKPPIRDPGKDIDHWEIKRTFQSYTKAMLLVDTVQQAYWVRGGDKEVFIVTTDITPVFKPGKTWDDMGSTKALLIELDTSDSIVTAMAPSKSKLFSALFAFSPRYGIRPLDKNEKLTLTRKDSTIWIIESVIRDFVFKTELDFSTNQTLTNNFIVDHN